MHHLNSDRVCITHCVNDTVQEIKRIKAFFDSKIMKEKSKTRNTLKYATPNSWFYGIHVEILFLFNFQYSMSENLHWTFQKCTFIISVNSFKSGDRLATTLKTEDFVWASEVQKIRLPHFLRLFKLSWENLWLLVNIYREIVSKDSCKIIFPKPSYLQFKITHNRTEQKCYLFRRQFYTHK